MRCDWLNSRLNLSSAASIINQQWCAPRVVPLPAPSSRSFINCNSYLTYFCRRRCTLYCSQAYHSSIAPINHCLPPVKCVAAFLQDLFGLSSLYTDNQNLGSFVVLNDLVFFAVPIPILGRLIIWCETMNKQVECFKWICCYTAVDVNKISINWYQLL